MRLGLTLLYNTILLFGGFAAAAAAVPPSFSFQVAKASHPLALDPSVSDPAWQAGKVPDNSAWANVTTRQPASDSTIASILYDDTNLSVAFVPTEPSATI